MNALGIPAAVSPAACRRCDWRDDPRRSRPARPRASGRASGRRDRRRRPRSRADLGVLANETDRVAVALLRLGVRQGEPVAFQLPNRLEFVTIALATLRSGAVCEPLMPIFRERELSFMLRESGARVLFVPDRFRGRDYAAMAAGAARRVAGARARGRAGRRACRPATPRRAASASQPATRPDRAAAVHLGHVRRAQGRAASPRRADARRRRSHRPLRTRRRRRHLRPVAARAPDRLPLRDVDRDPARRAAGAPGGLGRRRRARRDAAIRRHVRAGGDAVPGRPDAGGGGSGPDAGAAADVRRHRRGDPARAGAPRRARCSAPRSAARGARPRAASAARSRPGDPPERAWGTDGRALAGHPPAHRRRRGPAASRRRGGQLRGSLRLPVRGVPEPPGADRRGRHADGWYRTGDLARIDADGYVRITGRVKDVINRGGEKIPVAEIEQLLHAHPAVRDVAIVAMPDERLGERACAFVVLDAARTSTSTRCSST